MKGLFKVGVCIGALVMGVELAHGQSIYNKDYVAVAEKFDCSNSITTPNEGLLHRVERAARSSERRSREEALKAARKAVSRGYNYALMVPWSRRDYTKVVVTEMRYFNLRNELKKSQYSLACQAIPDQTAYEFMWGEKAAELEAASEVALIDLREMIKTLAPGDSLDKYRHRKPAVNEDLFARPGDRETHARQVSVQQEAGACFENLGPVSAKQFKRPVSAAEKSARDACLQGLIGQANAVGWTSHPGIVASNQNTLSSTGYTVNRPRSGPLAGSQPSGAVMAPADIWGEGWHDLSGDYPDFDGVFMTLEKPADGGVPSTFATLIASNTMPVEALLDHAVYYTAKTRLQARDSGILIKDGTPSYRDAFEEAQFWRQKKVDRAAVAQTRERGNREQKMERLTQSIERREKDIREIENQIELFKTTYDAPNPEVVIAQLQLGIDRSNERLASDRAELAKLRSGTSSAASEEDSVPLVSQTTSDASHRAAYTLFEQNYKNVLIFRGGTIRGSCSDSYLVCADKMQAYHAIGPRINAKGHQVLSPPSGYRPYDPTQ